MKPIPPLCRTVQTAVWGAPALMPRTLSMGMNAVPLPGQTFAADDHTAYIEFWLAHTFPVITTDGTTLLPAVVSHSWRKLYGKVFNILHFMKSYRQSRRDYILGSVVSVEFPDLDEHWIPPQRADAPGVHGVACLHKTAEGVPELLDQFAAGDPFTVSMEHDYLVTQMGLLVQGRRGVEAFEEHTPSGLRQQGWVYVPVQQAPEDLLRCFGCLAAALDGGEGGESRIVRDFRGQRVVAAFGGLNGQVNFKGVGLIPLKLGRGKEPEALVGQYVAGLAWADCGLDLVRSAIQKFSKKLTEVTRYAQPN